MNIAPMPTPGPGAGANAVSVMPITTIAAKIEPISCAAMYGITSALSSLPRRNTPRLTAGL